MKLKPFQHYLKQQNIDLAFLITPDSNIIYFTQIVPSTAHLLITSKDACLYTTKLDRTPKLRNIDAEELKKDWSKEVDKKIKKVGINEEKITYKQYQKLKKLFPKAKFIDISPKLKQLRAQKTEEEIKRIAKACKITTNAFNELINKFSKKFKTELDVALFLERKIKEQGAELAFPMIVASAKHSATPHHLTSTNKLKKGFLQLDFGAKHKNYCSDMSRVLFLGAIKKRQKGQKGWKGQKEHYNTLLNTQKKTIKQVSSGKKFSSLDKFARVCLGNCSSYFVHSLGHGLGIDIHEAPSLSSDEKGKVKNNQIFTVEPGVYFPKKYGLRIEDTIIFNGKTKILTKAPKELITIK